MRAASVFVLLAFVLAACGGTDPRPIGRPAAAPLRSLVAPPPASPVVETDRDEAQPIALDIPWPEAPACAFSTVDWRRARFGMTLRLKDGGPVFASIYGGATTLVMPAGQPRSAVANVRAAGVSVRGLTDRTSIRLRPTAPFAFGSVAAVKPSAVLSWVGGEKNSIDVKLENPPEQLLMKDRSSFVTRRSCGDLSVEPSSFDALRSIFEKRNSMVQLSGSPAVDLAPSPEGEPGATLLVPPDGVYVAYESTHAGRSRVAWDLGNVVAFGWVRSAYVSEARGSRGAIGMGGFGRSGTHTAQAIARVKCTSDVALAVEVDHDTRTVGQIDAGTVISVLAWGDERSSVWVPTNAIDLMPAARFMVSTAALRACAAD